jgi:phosphoglycolate phosphatase
MKAVLFDLDGTLLDTLTDIANCVNLMRAELSLPPHPRDAYCHFVGDGLKDLLMRAFPPRVLRGTRLTKLSNRFKELYAEHSMDETRPYPGISSMLNGVVRLGLPMAVVSNKTHHFTELCVKKLLSRWRFAVVLGARPDVPLKPDPTAPLAAARKMRVRPEDILYLGDTGVDMKTANAAGMFPVGALWGFRSAAELRRCGARVLIRKPGELLQLLRPS